MKTLYSRIACWAVVLAVALLGAACGGGDESGGTGGGGTGGAEGEPIRIGANLELSGDASVQGEAYANALELRADRINQQGGIMGRPVELVIRDNQTNPSEAVTITNSFVQEDVAAMIGPGTSPTTLAAMDTILQSGIPTISMGSAAAIVEPASEHSNVFKTTFSAPLAVQSMLEDMEQQGIERIGLIAVDNPYGEDGVTAWREAEQAGDIEITTIERFSSGDTDMTPQLRNITNTEAQAIVTWAIPPGAPTVRRNAVEDLGIEMPMYFDPGAGAEIFIDLAGESANGAIMIHPKTLVWDQVPEDDPIYDPLQTFGQAYTEQHGAMSGFAGYSWDALGLYKAAIERAGSTEQEAIVQALEGLEEYKGVDGTFNYTPENHEGLEADSLVTIEVRSGQYELLRR